MRPTRRYKHSKDAYEAGLCKRAEHRKGLKDNPRFLAIREKYKKVRMSTDEELRIVLEHCERTGRRPSKKSSTADVYRAWGHIYRTNKPLADEIRAKYPAVTVWSDGDTGRYAEQMIAFIKEHNRRPNTRLDDKRLCNILGTLLKTKADHPATLRLKEVLDQLPPVFSRKYYKGQQQNARRNAGRYGYKVVQDRGEDPIHRYVIYYTPDTDRNDRYEQKCKDSGMEIREWKE